jgi:hypothetical protein
MLPRNAGLLLIAAAVLFWLSWFLMPGVGVTDAAQILELVARQRSSVMLSVIVQLLSAALYIPALLGISCGTAQASNAGVRWGAGFLLLGAMGSAMDAVFHLVAYAMTMPGLEPSSLLKVMAFMQGPGLRLVAPFILGFFVGGIFLSIALTRKRAVSKLSAYMYLVALGIAVAGGAAASAGMFPSRIVGLSVLGAVSVSQALIGFELSRSRRQAAVAVNG